MRMRKLAFLLVPILLLAIVSCDGDIFGTLSDFMGQTGTNVYVEGGLVTIDTSQGAAVVDATSNLSSIDTDTDDGKAEYAAEVETVKNAITVALTSPQKTEALKEELAKPLTSTVPPKVTDAVTDIQTDLGITIAAPVTEGDLVTLVLLVEVYDKAQALETVLAKDPAALTPEEKSDLDAFVSDALQVIDMVNTLSSTGSISLDDMLTNLIDNPDLLNQIMGRSSSTSRDVARLEEEDVDDAMTFIEPIFNTVINAIGKDESGDIDSGKLAQAINSFKITRLSYEQLAPALVGSGAELELTDVINYVLSVVFTEADAFFDSVGTDLDLEDAINDVIDWIDGGKEGDPTFVGDIEDWGAAFEAFTAGKDRFSETGSIKSTLDALVGALSGDNTLITEALEDLFAGSDE